MEYKDKDGKSYKVSTVASNIIRVEKRCDRSILSGLHEIATGETTDIGGTVFGSVENLCAALYECSIPLDQQKETSFEDFCDRFDYPTLIELAPLLMTALFEGQRVPGGSHVPEGGGDGAGKAEAGTLETSTT